MIDKELARAMRGHGLTLAEIGREFGVSRERIRQIADDVHPQRSCLECGEEIPESAHRGRKYCDERCQKRARRAAHHGRCRCGNPKGENSELCKACRVAGWIQARKEKFTRLEALWSEGLSAAEIAEEFQTTPNALGVMVHRARAEGFDLPLRRAANPKSGLLTKQESRRQFAQALRAGVIRRCTRCEGCGATDCGIEGHHIDYDRPLYVHWLCSDCHMEAHGRTPYREKAAA